MTSGHVFIATSLDGFIARPDGALDWLPQGGAEDYGYADFIARMDGIVMGRASYETVRGFGDWPYELPVIVLSHTLPPGPVEGTTAEVLSAPPEQVMAELASRGWERAYVDGGAVIRDFLAAGLIEEIVLTRVPVLLGAGLPLFGALDGDLTLTHEATRSWPSGLVQSRYHVPEPRGILPEMQGS
ncbi:Dihydrofolate reductase [Pseudooceanicola antarcticus]|uniref:Dihydrofolate reductase n=1 Tax=Pseudooceanicola antarcticus TaxID=1247613 RepID=A0A285JA75_9RHOB|nr:dihydrofolate reductase family protein [Pseudooceanicola antarcticus]PJE30817.1 dihydrofolate reductase [Pseudooceanicola antarcticus]SNY57210.1 Dihydrofolate reductase [Pseudooceanicola antarcticus]